MPRISHKVQIPYSEFKELRSYLKQDKNMNAKVGKPAETPQYSTSIVTIRVVYDSQGPEYDDLVKKRIKYYEGTILDTLDESKRSRRVRLRSWWDKVWLPSLFIYAGITTAVISYQPALLSENELWKLISFLLLNIPTSIALGSTHLLLKK